MSGKQDGFGHELPFEGKTNDWITPKCVMDAFDKYSGKEYFFDLDPCASLTQPWPCAASSFTAVEDGLSRKWFGKVYLNPEYGPHTSKWVRRLAEYKNGIALIFARVETKLWQDFIFPSADGFLFPKRRIAFSHPNGTTPESSSGAPSAFIAWGAECNLALRELCTTGAIEGAYQGRALCTAREAEKQIALFEKETS